MYRVVCYVQVGLLHTGWFVTYRLVCCVQGGLLRTGWFVTYMEVCYSPCNVLHESKVDKNELSCFLTHGYYESDALALV